jgi:ABC-type transporter Mla MlaB component
MTTDTLLEAPPAATGGTGPRHVLPAELTIYVVADQLPQWLTWLDDPQAAATLTLEVAGVDQVDAAGLQLLVSLGQGLARRGRALRLASPAAAIVDACRQLGLLPWLHGVTDGETTR